MKVKVFSPATIANIAGGFDIIGMALNYPVDEMLLRKSHHPGVHINNISGADLPKQSNRNVVGVVLENILHNIPNNKYGIEVEIYKKIRPGSGIGSSAASAAGAAVGANLLFGNYFNTIEIVRLAMEGERLACGNAHADNISPAIIGGFTLVKSYSPLEIISLPTPKKLWSTVLHPNIEIKTYESRKILNKNLSMKDAIIQWGNIGSFVSALYKEDYCLMRKSLDDFIVEPIRSILIPAFYEIKIECKKVGALGGGISGSGPSIFMFSEGKEIAHRVAERMRDIYNKLAIHYSIYISSVNNKGVQSVLTN